jgi:hypothetical protein
MKRPDSAARGAVHESFLSYKKYRYLKTSLLVSALAAGWYAIDRPTGGANGGSWLGYVSGVAAAGLIGWLAWFGIQKRTYKAGAWSLSGWLSAHAYFGIGLALVATLHTGFHFGWNIHTLAYGLMMLVIVSGAFGTYTFYRYPSLVARNARGQTRLMLARQIVELDEECGIQIMKAGDIVSRIVLHAIGDRPNPPSIWQAAFRPLFAKRRANPTEIAVAELRRLLATRSKEVGPSVHEVLPLLVRRADLLDRLDRDVHYGAIMTLWRFVHVPATFALLVALTTHIVVVFYYR